MFANAQMGGVDFAFPDICKTPPLGIPIPYPNVAFGMMAVLFNPKVMFGGTPAHNLATFVPITFLDTPGLMGGIISGTVMGSSRHVTGCMSLLVGGPPATRLTSMTIQNTINAVGARIVPSQLKVSLLAP